MTEETDWIGGQVTSQGVPPDEHEWIEKFGATRRYRQYRSLVRKAYLETMNIIGEAGELALFSGLPDRDARTDLPFNQSFLNPEGFGADIAGSYTPLGYNKGRPDRELSDDAGQRIGNLCGNLQLTVFIRCGEVQAVSAGKYGDGLPCG